MDSLKNTKGCKLIYGKNRKLGALLFHHPDKENGPSSTIEYWEYNKDYRKMILDFTSEVYGKDRLDKYWNEILELDENKKLTLDTLCDTIENVLFKDMN